MLDAAIGLVLVKLLYPDLSKRHRRALLEPLARDGLIPRVRALRRVANLGDEALAVQLEVEHGAVALGVQVGQRRVLGLELVVGQDLLELLDMPGEQRPGAGRVVHAGNVQAGRALTLVGHDRHKLHGLRRAPRLLVVIVVDDRLGIAALALRLVELALGEDAALGIEAAVDLGRVDQVQPRQHLLDELTLRAVERVLGLGRRAGDRLGRRVWLARAVVRVQAEHQRGPRRGRWGAERLVPTVATSHVGDAVHCRRSDENVSGGIGHARGVAERHRRVLRRLVLARAPALGVVRGRVDEPKRKLLGVQQRERPRRELHRPLVVASLPRAVQQLAHVLVGGRRLPAVDPEQPTLAVAVAMSERRVELAGRHLARHHLANVDMVVILVVRHEKVARGIRIRARVPNGAQQTATRLCELVGINLLLGALRLWLLLGAVGALLAAHSEHWR